MSNTTIVRLAQAVLETISESTTGAPSTSLYLAFQELGTDLETYQRFMDSLERIGLIRQAFHCYYITAGGQEYLRRVSESLATQH